MPAAFPLRRRREGRRPPRLRHSAAHSSASWSASTCRPHPCNIPGEASGRLAGGNLAVICAAAGTPEELRTDTPTVLFIEEVGEFLFRIDRMMQSLERSGRLRTLRAVVVGHFTDIMGCERFGAEDPLRGAGRLPAPLGIPVIYGFPAGHEDPNLSLYLGREVTVSVGTQGASLLFR